MIREKFDSCGFECVPSLPEANPNICTHLNGKASWFRAFYRKWNDGAGNPPKGILETFDMESYRLEKQAGKKIVLPYEDAEVEAVPTSEAGGRGEPELDRLSNIISAFNDLFGDIEWEERDRVHELITETIPGRVAEDTAFKNA